MEITIPLFLQLEYPEQFRVKDPIGEGGSGVVHFGEFLDPNLVAKHSSSKIVVKFLKGTFLAFLKSL